MSPQMILALISDLYAQIVEQTQRANAAEQRVAELEAQAGPKAHYS